MLASLLYPYDTGETGLPGLVEQWLCELARENCVRLYEVDGAHYLEIVNWLKHQKIDHPSKSKLPGPSDMFAKPREDIGDPRASRARGLDLGPGPRTKDLDLDQGANSRARAKMDDWPDDYGEQFAAAYPNKVGMKPALAELDAARVTLAGKTSWRVVMDALATYAAKTDDRKWLNPKKWIDEERWNDKPGKADGNGGHAAKPSAGDRARELARAVEAREREGAPASPPDAVGGAELGGDDARLLPGHEHT